MDVQTPYALDLTSLLFTAFTLGFTPLLLVGILFRWAIHPITLLYKWLTEEPKPPPLLTPWSPSYPVAVTPRSSSSARSPYAGASSHLPLPDLHEQEAGGSPGGLSRSSSRRYSPTLRAQSLRSQNTYAYAPSQVQGTGTYLNISYSPGLGASLSVGARKHEPNLFGLGLADKATKYQPTLRRMPLENRPVAYRPETARSIAEAQAHASAQPLALDRSFRLADEDKWDRTERWRREILDDEEF